MGSNQKQTRQLQKEQFEQQIEKRRALLAEKGIDARKTKKDKVICHMQAELKRTVEALKSIENQEKIIEKAKVQKQANAEQKKVAEPKKNKKKKEADAPAETEGKKKEKKPAK